MRPRIKTIEERLLAKYKALGYSYKEAYERLKTLDRKSEFNYQIQALC